MALFTSSVRNTLFLLALNLRAQTVLLRRQVKLLISSMKWRLATWSTYFYEPHPLSSVLKPFKAHAGINSTCQLTNVTPKSMTCLTYSSSVQFYSFTNANAVIWLAEHWISHYQPLVCSGLVWSTRVQRLLVSPKFWNNITKQMNKQNSWED